MGLPFAENLDGSPGKSEPRRSSRFRTLSKKPGQPSRRSLMRPGSFGCAEGVKVLGGADENGFADQRGRGQDLFVEFVLGQDRWGVGGGVHHGDDSFFGREVNAAGGGDSGGPIIIGGVDPFVL